MRHRLSLLLLLASMTLSGLSGCQIVEHWLLGDEHSDELDGNWRQGYGFNNPNYDRLSKGLEPEPF